MARRPGSGEEFVSPRARRIAGWVAAILLIGGVALALRLLGGNGDGTSVAPSPSGPGPTTGAEITFGTALDPATGQVAEDARTDRFTAGDPFSYSVVPPDSVPPEVYVEVVRAGDGEAVQAPVSAQAVNGDRAIAFSVEAAALLEAFGPGHYTMLIYADPDEDPIAEGSFELAGAGASPSTSPSP